MDPREFQELASKLARGSGAAELRTAVSRAYYAVYNLSTQLLTAMDFPPGEGPGGHGQVVKLLSNSGDLEVINFGSQLGTLHGKRIRADYRLDKMDVENPKTVQALVKQAAQMISICDSCSAEPRHSQVKKGIQAYMNKISPAS